MIYKVLQFKQIHGLKGERSGLTMIVASLVVICVLVGLLFGYQHRVQTADLRIRGVSLVRILAGMPYEQLVPDSATEGPLRVLRASQENTDFAYAIVTGAQGQVLAEATAPGFVIPQSLIPEELSNWQGERIVSATGYDRELIEFYAPIIGADDSLANLRLGFFRPAYGPSFQQLPFFATLALVVFMLTPLFYLMLRREIQPLRDANRELSTLMNDGHFGVVQVQASPELGDFMQRFNQFIELAKGRIKTLEATQVNLETSKKLLTYRKERIQTVLQALPDAVMVLNETGEVTFANRRLEILLGVSAEDVVGKPTAAWCKDPAVSSYLAQYDTEDVGTAFDDSTIRFNSLRSPERKLAMKSYPLFSPREAGEIYGNLIVLRDVSREAQAEEGRANFVAHLAHELKTPLHTLALYSELLLGPDGKDERVRVDACNVIHDEVERLSALVSNMLNITKMETGSLSLERQRVRLRDLLKDVFNHISKSAGAGDLTFDLLLPRKLSAVAVDKDLLRIALNNLLANAIKYSEPGGTVSLSASETADTIEIRVSDTGLGVALEDQERIFEKFYRSDDENARKRGGHGLGLSLAKDIIELHQGRLSVESALGEGAEFIITLQKKAGLVQQAI